MCCGDQTFAWILAVQGSSIIAPDECCLQAGPLHLRILAMVKKSIFVFTVNICQISCVFGPRVQYVAEYMYRLHTDPQDNQITAVLNNTLTRALLRGLVVSGWKTHLLK